ncbi:MAG: TrmH family RNA methyltransferase [Acidimicrobiia bacterium]|nr:TrmH family RNA methyltransferase [Acidimicrobiia bacterium]
MTTIGLVDLFRAARQSADLATLEGFHAVKHAVRFGAHLEALVVVGDIGRLCRRLAPDLEAQLELEATEVPESTFRDLVPAGHPTRVAAVARRPAAPWHAIDANRKSPAVLLEDPRHPGNVGAVIRIAAAAGASGVATTGSLDPWTPTAIRGSAGLHFALPVVGLKTPPPTDRPVWVFDPGGEALARPIPSDAVLVFGSERDGVSDDIRSRADRLVSLPMESGVSSINLAASVAVGLYAWRLGMAG